MLSVAIVGGGFGGIGAALMLRRAGYTDATVFERSERVGGVWHHNTYPGAACDIPSHLYEFSFAPNPRWSRRFAPQAEIQAYLAERRAARRARRAHVDRGARGARSTDGRWTLETSAGTVHQADVLITALRAAVGPERPGAAGARLLRRPRVPHRPLAPRRRPDRPARGRARDGLQRDPGRAGDRGHGRRAVDVYQRSPGWTIPKLDFAYSERAKRAVRALAGAAEARPRVGLGLPRVRRARHDAPPVAAGPDEGGGAAAGPARRSTTLRCGDRSRRRDALGCKRIMLTDDWYPTLARDDVSLVTDPIEAVTAGGIRAGGRERAADVLVLATGFKAHEFVAPLEVEGPAGGRSPRPGATFLAPTSA